jgi:hypothetical protein
MLSPKFCFLRDLRSENRAFRAGWDQADGLAISDAALAPWPGSSSAALPGLRLARAVTGCAVGREPHQIHSGRDGPLRLADHDGQGAMRPAGRIASADIIVVGVKGGPHLAGTGSCAGMPASPCPPLFLTGRLLQIRVYFVFSLIAR